MNNHVQFACLQCCVPSDFVVQISNFFSLVLFCAIIHKRKGKKQNNKKIKYKLDTSSKMQFAFFILETLKNLFRKLSILSKNLEMTQIAGSKGSYSLRHYDVMRTNISAGFIPY